MSRWRELNSWPLPYQGSALPLSYNGIVAIALKHLVLLNLRREDLPALKLRQVRAEDEVRTRDQQHGRLSLYQLSYFRIVKYGSMEVWEYGSEISNIALTNAPTTQRSFLYPEKYSHNLKLSYFSKWARMDSNHRTPERTDLQSVVVGHLTTCPMVILNACPGIAVTSEPERGIEPATCWLQISCSTNWATQAWFHKPCPIYKELKQMKLFTCFFGKAKVSDFVKWKNFEVFFILNDSDCHSFLDYWQ